MKESQLQKKSRIKAIIGLCVSMIIIGLVWIMPIRSQNVSILLFTDGTYEGRTVQIRLTSENAYEKEYWLETTIQHNIAWFTLDYEYISIDEIATNCEEIVDTAIGFNVLGHGYTANDYVAASFVGEVFEYTDEGMYVFTDEALNELKEGINNPWLLKVLLTILIICVVISVFVYNRLKAHFGVGKATGVLVIVYLCLYILNVFNREELLSNEISIGQFSVTNGFLIIALLCVFATLMIVCILFDNVSKYSKYLIVGIYFISWIFAVGKMSFYCEKVAQTPDEGAHIAYVLYLEEEKCVIPEFEEMHLIKTLGNDNGIMHTSFDETTTNYLVHPPLYYHIMNLIADITIEDDGTFKLNIEDLRVASMSIVAFSLMLIFYIGYSRIAHIPILHLLYSMICISVPMLTYGASGLNNDSLAMLTVTVFFLGIIRYVEKKRTFFTYLLIAIGINATMLTKLTAGIIVVVSACIVLIYTLIKEKNGKELLTWSFIGTLPLYLLTFVYYIYIYLNYGSFQIGLFSINEEYARSTGLYVPIANRAIMGFIEYLEYYYKKFMMTWNGIVSHIVLVKPDKGAFLETIALTSIWFIPLLLFGKKVRKNIKHILCILSIYVGILITLVLQIYSGYSGFCTRGYMGGLQSRYYLCAIVGFAFAITALVEYLLICVKGENKYAQILKQIIIYVVIAFIGLLLYEDFIYFLLYYRNYIS